MERVFYPFGYVDIYHDVYDWFIVFDSRASAIQAQRFIHDKHLHVLGHPINLSIPSLNSIHPTSVNSIHPTTINTVHATSLDSTYHASIGSIHPSITFPLKSTLDYSPKSEPVDINSTAKQILFEELADIFLKDIKSRIAGPCIYDFLSPSLISKENLERPKIENITTTAAALESDIVAHALEDTQDVSIYKLPRFKRKSISHVTPPKAEDDEKDDVDIGTSEEESRDPSPPLRRLSDETTRPTKKQKSMPKKKLLQSNTSSDDNSTKIPQKKNIIKRKRLSLSKKTNNNIVIEEPLVQNPSLPAVNSPSNLDIDVDGDDSEEEKQELRNMVNRQKEDEKRHTYQEFEQATLEKILKDVDKPDMEEELWSKPEPEVELSKEWDPFCQTKDVEDLEYLRVALIEKVDPNTNTTNNGKLDNWEFLHII